MLNKYLNLYVKVKHNKIEGKNIFWKNKQNWCHSTVMTYRRKKMPLQMATINILYDTINILTNYSICNIRALIICRWFKIKMLQRIE